jgi:uncharacterized protein YndB with AHSA1/START domain
VEEIDLRFSFAAPRERVFDVVGDHERFLANARTRTTVTRAGSPDPNGRGCLRTVETAPRIRFVEEITSWEPPSSLEYVIRESSLPLRHHGGRITFTEERGGTVVSWTSRFEIEVPVVGRLLEKVAKTALERAFGGFLRAAKPRIEGAR